MKTYKITYWNGWYEFDTRMEAPNKTMARKYFKGEYKPSCKILSIVEVTGD